MILAPCQRCLSTRMAYILARCSDMCTVELAGRRRHDYVPRDLGIGGGDDVQLTYCLDCGQLQGRFPLPQTNIEAGREE